MKMPQIKRQLRGQGWREASKNSMAKQQEDKGRNHEDSTQSAYQHRENDKYLLHKTAPQKDIKTRKCPNHVNISARCIAFCFFNLKVTISIT